MHALSHADAAEILGGSNQTATYIRNRCPTKGLKGCTPEEAWSKQKPDVSHFRVFGCKAYMHVPDQRRQKPDAKAKECVFLGIDESFQGYRLWDTESKRVVRSRDVTFSEISHFDLNHEGVRCNEQSKMSPSET